MSSAEKQYIIYILNTGSLSFPKMDAAVGSLLEFITFLISISYALSKCSSFLVWKSERSALFAEY
jgi:hypothetical protein